MLTNKSNRASILLSNSETIELLNTLVDLNAIEYYFITKFSVSVKLKYKDFEPILKSIKCFSRYSNSNITLSFAKKELNNKKSIYIVQTSLGILTLDKAVYNNVGGMILYKITI
jgi:ribosomal protein S8